MRHAAWLIAAVLVSMGQRGDVRPSFLIHHKVMSARSEIFIQVRVPEALEARTVTLEAWLLEPEPLTAQENGFVSEWVIPAKRERVALASSSQLDIEPRKTIYGFRWRHGLDAGDYELQAVVTLPGGRTRTSKPSLITVR